MPEYPDRDEITFADVKGGRWPISLSCDRCRVLKDPYLGRDLGPIELVPISQLWARGRLVCRDCGNRLTGVQISEPGGNMMFRKRVIAAWYEPGHWPDPDVVARWGKK